MEQELEQTIEKLKAQLRAYELEYGDRMYDMRTPDGAYLVAPVITAILNGQVALINFNLAKKWKKIS